MSKPSPLASSSSHAVIQPKKKAPGNPLQRGIWGFLLTSQLASADSPTFSAASLPKRFTLYSPLLLLPINFPSHDASWQGLYSQLGAIAKLDLFSSIAKTFISSGQNVTHIALNAPIPSFELGEQTLNKCENVLRRPCNLIPVHGDFGPSSLLHHRAIFPSQRDFDAAFWVTTKQSRHPSQVWAPRWTMFSRGNVTEKERILSTSTSDPFPGLSASELGQALGEVDVLDMYIGIGYFAFLYLARGVKRVWGWDLNPWSIEGLRRGCEANGWRCLIVRVAENGCLDGMSVEELAYSVVDSDENDEQPSIRGGTAHAYRTPESM